MKTINLLPKARQKELYYDSLLHGVVVLFVASLFSFAAVIGVQAGVKFYLQKELGSIRQQITQLEGQINKKENSTVKTQVQAVNNTVSDYQSLVDSAPKWSKLVKAFVVLPPAGLRIDSFSVDPQSRAINIAGVSPTRDLVIKLYQNVLADTKNFYGINYPLENIVKTENVPFHFTFYYKAEVIK